MSNKGYTGNTINKCLSAIKSIPEAAELSVIRYHAGRGTNTLPRSEGSTIPDNMLETTDDFIKDCERVIDLYHDPDPFSMRQIVIAPCQPINSYRETYVESVALARGKSSSSYSFI